MADEPDRPNVPQATVVPRSRARISVVWIIPILAAVVAIGVAGEPGNGLHWRRVAPLLRNRGVRLPPRHIVRQDAGAELEAQRLTTFLASYDLPAEEQHRWRV